MNTRTCCFICVAFLTLASLPATAAEAEFFDPLVEHWVADHPTTVASGDLDGDGNPDMVVVNHLENNISVLLGAGKGTFEKPMNFRTGEEPRSVAMGDLDSDGHVDVVVANFGSDTVSVLLGNGNGTLQAAVEYGTGDGPGSLFIGDMDGEGSPDLIVANWNSFSVSTLSGKGDGTFQLVANNEAVAGIHFVDRSDLIDDQIPDLSVVKHLGDDILALTQPSRLILFVDDDAPGDPGPGDPDDSDPQEDGTADHPFDEIQEAINVSFEGDTCLVLPGTYIENIDYQGKNITLRSDVDGDPGTVDISPETTIIDGGAAGPVVNLENGETEDAVLFGFTIRNGSYEGIRCSEYTSYTSMTVANCIVTENSRGFDCMTLVSHLTIMNCAIYGNDWDGINGGFGDGVLGVENCLISGNGYGVFLENHVDLAATNCEILGNGTGIYTYKACVDATSCIVSGNGGGISLYEPSESSITNCMVSDNSGYGIFIGSWVDLVITNCNLAGNGGIEFDCSFECTAEITNSILWGTASPGDPEIDVHHTSIVTAQYSNIQMESPGDVWPGTDNINEDPLFVAGPEGCYYLSNIVAGQSADSPCIGAGSDLAGNICFTSAGGTRCMDEWTTRTDHVKDSDIVDMGYHHGNELFVPCPATVAADMACTPATGTLPFVTTMTATMSNLCTGHIRVVAAHIDATLAAGNFYPHWRAGFTNLSAGGACVRSFPVMIPELGTVTGDNMFTLVVEDVTQSPYNQPPYSPAGDSDTASCTVTGMAP